MAKTLLVTLELPVRAMTEQEWTEAWDGCGHDADEDEGPDREATLEVISPADIAEAIAGALNSVTNGEMLAGSGLFVHTDDAVITSIIWK